MAAASNRLNPTAPGVACILIWEMSMPTIKHTRRELLQTAAAFTCGIAAVRPSSAAASPACPAGLESAAHDNPAAAQRKTPLLSWGMEDPRPGAKQTAYQIMAGSSPEKLAAGEADLWNSGEVLSDQSLFIASVDFRV